MFQFPGFASALRQMTGLAPRRVAPFGHLGITACVPLPRAYRSLPRPSSPLCAQASPTCHLSLDIPICQAVHAHSCTLQSLHREQTHCCAQSNDGIHFPRSPHSFRCQTAVADPLRSRETLSAPFHIPGSLENVIESDCWSTPDTFIRLPHELACDAPRHPTLPAHDGRTTTLALAPVQ
jgi:hypothetical protein